MNLITKLPLFALASVAQDFLKEDKNGYIKRLEGAHCANYIQLSISSPGIEHCMALAEESIAKGKCHDGQGFFSYGWVHASHQECTCCLEGDDALSHTIKHNSFNIF